MIQVYVFNSNVRQCFVCVRAFPFDWLDLLNYEIPLSADIHPIERCKFMHFSHRSFQRRSNAKNDEKKWYEN